MECACGGMRVCLEGCRHKQRAQIPGTLHLVDCVAVCCSVLQCVAVCGGMRVWRNEGVCGGVWRLTIYQVESVCDGMGVLRDEGVCGGMCVCRNESVCTHRGVCVEE